jgi:hypothetical protein
VLLLFFGPTALSSKRFTDTLYKVSGKKAGQRKDGDASTSLPPFKTFYHALITAALSRCGAEETDYRHWVACLDQDKRKDHGRIIKFEPRDVPGAIKACQFYLLISLRFFFNPPSP